MFELSQLLVSIQLRLFKKNVVADLYKNCNQKRALLYYKTDPLASSRLVKLYSHTNNAEIIIMLNLLKKNGFIVDLVDRSAQWHQIQPLQKNDYDLFLGIGSGNFKFFNKIKLNFKIGKTVILGTGPEPLLSNRLVMDVHNECSNRNNQNFSTRRLIQGSEEDIKERYRGVSAVFYYGNNFNKEAWSLVTKNLFRILPSTSPSIDFSMKNLQLKQKNRFLYFAANGLICKGLDLVIEAFDGLDGVFLDICAPFDEIDFWRFYKPIVDRNKSINVHGFVKVGSDKFNELTQSAAFNIFPGSAEGCSTSVITTMRRGVIPIVTCESGIDEKFVKYVIKDKSVENLKKMIVELTKKSSQDINAQIVQTYINSCSYTNSGFSDSFESALMHVMLKKKDE